MDRLTSLTVFVKVVDCGGFSAAALRLNLSTTMVSSHIQSLESRLGTRLLNRTTRRVSLTETGKAYYERCLQILTDLEEADRVAGAREGSKVLLDVHGVVLLCCLGWRPRAQSRRSLHLGRSRARNSHRAVKLM